VAPGRYGDRIVEIRSIAAGDDVTHLGPPHGPDADAPRRRRTVLAADGNVILGAGTVMWSVRHPDVVFARIDVDERARRHGIGTALLARLEGLAEPPLLFNIPPAAAADAFLSARGYQCVVRSATHRGRVEELLADLGAPTTEHAVIAAEPLTDAVVQAYDEIYRHAHQGMGRYTPPPDAPWIGFAGPVVEGTVHAARVGGRVVGVTSLHAGPYADGADASLPPTKVIGGLPLDQRVEVLRTLLARTLAAGRAAGIESVNIECDMPTYDDLAVIFPTLTMTPLPHLELAGWLRA
jgi:GNAT superfamily N-acetyltransferase